MECVRIMRSPVPLITAIVSLEPFTGDEQIAVGQFLLHRYIDRYNYFYMDVMDIQDLCDSLFALIKRWGPVYTWYEGDKYSFCNIREDIINEIRYI